MQLGLCPSWNRPLSTTEEDTWAGSPHVPALRFEVVLCRVLGSLHKVWADGVYDGEVYADRFTKTWWVHEAK